MLRFDKLTLKAQEAVQAAQEIAAERGHRQIEPLHLLAALAAQQDDIVVFNPLGREHLERIVEIQLVRVRDLLAARGITLELTPAAAELLFREGFDPAYGARPLKRAIQRLIQDPLAARILEGSVLAGGQIVADADAACGQIRFEHTTVEAVAASNS